MSYTNLRKIIDKRITMVHAILDAIKKDAPRMEHFSDQWWDGKLAGYQAVIDIIDDLDSEAPDMVE